MQVPTSNTVSSTMPPQPAGNPDVMYNQQMQALSAAPGDIPMHLQEKIGAKCCGCLCDYRRAVIWGNSVFIGLSTFILMSRETVVDFVEASYEDDAISGPAKEIVDDYYARRSIGVGIVLGTAILAQFGAASYQIWLVVIHILATIADFVVFCFLALEQYRDLQDITEGYAAQPEAPLLGFLVNTAITLLVLYPNVGLVLENKLGILTRETYPREAYSCCCSPKQQYLLPQPGSQPVTVTSGASQGTPGTQTNLSNAA